MSEFADPRPSPPFAPETELTPLEAAGLRLDAAIIRFELAGAFATLKRRTRNGTSRMQAARRRLSELIERLRDEGLADDEIRRAFEAELLEAAGTARER